MRFLIFASVLLFALSVSSSVSAQSLNKAFDLIEQSKCPEAIKEVEPLLNQKKSLFSPSEDVKKFCEIMTSAEKHKNLERLSKDLRELTEKGNPFAQIFYARLLMKKNDDQAAFKLLEQAERNDGRYGSDLSDEIPIASVIYSDRLDELGKKVEAVDKLNSAAEKGNNDAISYLKNRYGIEFKKPKKVEMTAEEIKNKNLLFLKNNSINLDCKNSTSPDIFLYSREEKLYLVMNKKTGASLSLASINNLKDKVIDHTLWVGENFGKSVIYVDKSIYDKKSGEVTSLISNRFFSCDVTVK